MDGHLLPVPALPSCGMQMLCTNAGLLCPQAGVQDVVRYQYNPAAPAAPAVPSAPRVQPHLAQLPQPGHVRHRPAEPGAARALRPSAGAGAANPGAGKGTLPTSAELSPVKAQPNTHGSQQSHGLLTGEQTCPGHHWFWGTAAIPNAASLPHQWGRKRVPLL